MMQSQTYTTKHIQPSRWKIFTHVGKTLKLINGLMSDRRISLWRKLLFVGSIGGLLLLLFFPDLFNETFLSAVFPLIGTVVGVPIDAGFDWMAFSMVALNLLQILPNRTRSRTLPKYIRITHKIKRALTIFQASAPLFTILSPITLITNELCLSQSVV